MSSAIVSNQMESVGNTCVICHKSYEGYGNNAQPVVNGQCCDRCNRIAVLPARMSYSIISDDDGPHCGCCNKTFSTNSGYKRHRRNLRTKHCKEMMLMALSKETVVTPLEQQQLYVWWLGLDEGL